jgi:hypothetical protein
LGKVVDWTTLKAAPDIHIPTQRDIPQGVLKFPEGGLSVRRTIPEKADPYVSSDLFPNSDSDGSQPMKLSNNPTAVASKRLRMRKRTRDDEHLPLLQAGDVHLDQHTASTSNTAGVSGSGGANVTSGTSGSGGAIQPISATYPRIPRDNLRMMEIRSNLGAFAPAPPVLETGLYGSNIVAVWKRCHKQQEDQIQTLTRDINALLKETVDKSVIIADQKAELECLPAFVKEPTTTNNAWQEVVTTAETEDIEMEVDVVALDHVVENVTYGLVETETMPLGRRRATFMPPPP